MSEWNNKDLGAITAYALAVEHGYTGTETEWVNHISYGIKRALSANSIIFPEKIGAYFTGMTKDIDGKTLRNMQACVFLNPSLAIVAFDAFAETSASDKTGYRRLQRVSMVDGSVLTSINVDIGHGNSLAYDHDNTVAVACYSPLNAGSEYSVKTFDALTLEQIDAIDLAPLVSPYFATYAADGSKHIVSIFYHQAARTWIVMGGGYLHDGGRICVELSADFSQVVGSFTLSADVGKIEAAQDATCDNDYIYVMCGRYDTVAVFDMAAKNFVGAFTIANYYNDDMYIGETESLTVIDGIMYINARVRPCNPGGGMFGIVNSFGKFNLWGSFGSNGDYNATRKGRAVETRTLWVNSEADNDSEHYTNVNFFTATGAFSKPFKTIYEALCIRHEGLLQINLISDVTTPIYIVNDNVYIAGRKNDYKHADEKSEDPGDEDESSDDPFVYNTIGGIYVKDSKLRISGCIINGLATKTASTGYLIAENSIVDLGGCPDIQTIAGDNTYGIILNNCTQLRWKLLSSVPKTIQSTCAYFAMGVDVLSMQTGTETSNSEGKITVTFPVAMKSTPVIFAIASGSSATNIISCKISSASPTGFSAIATRVVDTDGSLSFSVAQNNTIRWIAVVKY